MKKSVFLVLGVLLAGSINAKKVKFAVDMSNETVSPNGVHITGDFQAIAGLGADWSPGTALMTKEGNTNIYSIVINLPAFRKYEYRFINGDLSYEAEFVPEESRVGYNFVDNRWLYVDSLQNDTTFVGAIVYSKNAPAGKTLIRFKVDMTYAGTIPATGVHVGGSHQPVFNPVSIRLYSFGSNVYEIINYVTNNTYSYLYYNGNTGTVAETVPASCATSGKRSIAVVKDTVLPALCFASCAVCQGLGLTKNTLSPTELSVYPNPAGGEVNVQAQVDEYSIRINDLLGKELVNVASVNRAGYKFNISDFKTGVYFVTIVTKTGNSITQKLVVQ